MPTYSQLIRKPRTIKNRSKRVPALEQCPQKKGVCIKLVTRTPKKPNSAIRKLALLRLSNRKRIYGYIPGEGKHSLQEHSAVSLVYTIGVCSNLGIIHHLGCTHHQHA